MKVSRRRGGKDERKILIGMIVNRAVLSHISSHWESDLFKSKWANLIGQWCVDFFGKYEKPPRKDIESIFRKWAEKVRNDKQIEIIEKFLTALSGEYETASKELNSDYLIDLAGGHFNCIRLKRVADEVSDDIDRGDDQKAYERWAEFRRIELGTTAGIDFFQDREAIRQAIESKQEPLIKYRGALGKFFGNSLCRDALIAFEGPEKRGKSFWLLDMALTGMLQRRRVAYFVVGDMSQNQVGNRIIERVAKRPRYASEVKYPTKIKKIKGERGWIEGKVSHKIKRFNKPIGWGTAVKICEEVMRTKVKSKNSYLKLSCHPTGTVSLVQIKSILHDWERDDWTADIIVIDYADILIPEHRTRDHREGINQTWIQLRSLSQIFHSLVVTASQTDAASYKTHTITMSNFSEDKRKMGHVDGLISLNQTFDEKLMDIMRLRWVLERERSFTREVFVAGCRSISNVAILSCF